MQVQVESHADIADKRPALFGDIQAVAINGHQAVGNHFLEAALYGIYFRDTECRIIPACGKAAH